MVKTLQSTDKLNPIYMMANSGARGSFKQIRQLAGMRGPMANPKGEIIERPIKANFIEGLSVLEYFISTHGARKGLADTALRTADSGYLTRRLVDVAQDVIIREQDCGTEDYIELDSVHEHRRAERGPDRARRCAADQDQARPDAGRAGRRNRQRRSRRAVEVFTEDHEKSKDTLLPVRSVLKCQAPSGVCQACYGRAMATGALAQIGDAVGIVAAQSIGEPGTQLTMRTFHTGGVAGADITHGLPRVVELFEARRPKGVAELASHPGVVSIEETEKAVNVTVTDDAGDEHRYSFPKRTRLYVTHGEKISAGKQLNEGSVYPHDMLAIDDKNWDGRTQTERYLVREVQAVYKSQGVDINDKHIELIVRQMLKKVRVDQKGDTDYLPGQFVDRFELQKTNDAVRAEKGEEAEVADIILGITKASLNTDSFLSAASFQETTKVLTDAALEGKIDRLNGLKENVIIGKLIPAATGLKRYRRIEIEPAQPLPRAVDEVGLLDQSEIEAELGLRLGHARDLRARARGRHGLARRLQRRRGRHGVCRGARRALRPGREQRGVGGGRRWAPRRRAGSYSPPPAPARLARWRSRRSRPPAGRALTRSSSASPSAPSALHRARSSSRFRRQCSGCSGARREPRASRRALPPPRAAGALGCRPAASATRPTATRRRAPASRSGPAPRGVSSCARRALSRVSLCTRFPRRRRAPMRRPARPARCRAWRPAPGSR